MSVKLLTPWGPYPINAIITLDAATEAALVSAGQATSNTAGGVVYNPPVDKTSFGLTKLYGAYTVQPTDDDDRFKCMAALTVTLTEASADTIIFPPDTGNLTISVSGLATIAGGTTPVTRALATGSNRLGIAIIRNPGSNDFGISGA